MIYKDQNGKEFNVTPETFVNPYTGKAVTTNTNAKPVLNPKGEQVINPILHYEYLGEQNVEEIGGDYPYLYFGSEFAREEVRALPTPNSNAINTVANSLSDSQNASIIMSQLGDPNIHSEELEKITDESKRAYAIALISEFVSNMKTNVLAIYNNNLRIILENFLVNDSFKKELYLDIDINPMILTDILVSVDYNQQNGPTFGIVPAQMSFVKMPGIKADISMRISAAYNSLINSLLALGAVDFYTLAKSKIDTEKIHVPSEYIYSYGVDIVREIANMEVGRSIDLAEINLSHIIIKYNNFLSQNN